MGSELRGEPVHQDGVQATLQRMRALPGLSLRATTARDLERPNSIGLDIDTQFDPDSGAVRSATAARTRWARCSCWVKRSRTACSRETNLGVMFGAASDYEEYHGLGILANVGIGARGGRAALSGFSRAPIRAKPIVDRDDYYLRDRRRRVHASACRASRGPRCVVGGARCSKTSRSCASGVRLRDERLRMLGWARLELAAGPRYAVRRRRRSSSKVSTGWAAASPRSICRGSTARRLHADAARLTRATLERPLVGAPRCVLQQTAYTLPYSERFKIGGDRLGRGFEVAEIAGDQGIGAKVEVRRGLHRCAEQLGRASVYGFYDIGAAWKQDAPGRESAATAGFGFATQGGRVTGSIELAQPLTHPDVEGRKELTLFAEIALAL